MTGWTLLWPFHRSKSSSSTRSHKSKHKHSHSAPEPTALSCAALAHEQPANTQASQTVLVHDPVPPLRPQSIPILSLPSPSATSSSLPSPTPSPSTSASCFYMPTPHGGASTAASSLHVPESRRPSRSPSPIVNPNYRTVDYDEESIDGLTPKEYYGSYVSVFIESIPAFITLHC